MERVVQSLFKKPILEEALSMGDHDGALYRDARSNAGKKQYSLVSGHGLSRDEDYLRSSRRCVSFPYIFGVRKNDSFSDDSSEKEGSCLPWLKYGIFAANIVFMVSLVELLSCLLLIFRFFSVVSSVSN